MSGSRAPARWQNALRSAVRRAEARGVGLPVRPAVRDLKEPILPVGVLLLARRAGPERGSVRKLEVPPVPAREQAVGLLAATEAAREIEPRHLFQMVLLSASRYQGPMNSPLGWVSKTTTTMTMQTIEAASRIASSRGRCLCIGGNSICRSRTSPDLRGVLTAPPLYSPGSVEGPAMGGWLGAMLPTGWLGAGRPPAARSSVAWAQSLRFSSQTQPPRATSMRMTP